MDFLKEKMQEALSFSASEKRALIVVLLILLFSWFLPEIKSIFYPQDKMFIETSLVQFEKQLSTGDSIVLEESTSERITARPFNPNNVTYEEMVLMGLPKDLSQRVVNFRKAGGQFKRRSDLLKIYGMPQTTYHALAESILLDNEPSKKKRNNGVKIVLMLDLNKVDSASLIALRGIGPVYAKRIINYREALGGFIDKEQLREVYGINDSLYFEISDRIEIADSGTINKININRCDVKELRGHPYFRNWNLSNSIIKFRKSHGEFESIDDLRKVFLLNDSILAKVTPYIRFE